MDCGSQNHCSEDTCSRFSPNSFLPQAPAADEHRCPLRERHRGRSFSTSRAGVFRTPRFSELSLRPLIGQSPQFRRISSDVFDVVIHFAPVAELSRSARSCPLPCSNNTCRSCAGMGKQCSHRRSTPGSFSRGTASCFLRSGHFQPPPPARNQSLEQTYSHSHSWLGPLFAAQLAVSR